jgi:ankyrin repeat protein
MRLAIALIAACVPPPHSCNAEELTRNQRLIVACHRLDPHLVTKLLREGADVNARFGRTGRPEDHFRDPWSGGWPANAYSWTPLLALAHASRFPEPSRQFDNSEEHRRWVIQAQSEVLPNVIEERKTTRLSILRMLVSHNCNVDIADNKGGTPLHWAIRNHHGEFVRELLKFNPQVNTTCGIYLDDFYGRTPLSAAAWSREITQLLIEHGAVPQD